MYRCENQTIKKAESRKWYWRGLLRISWTARRSNQSILKETNREYSFNSVHLLSRVRLFATPWISACQASMSITNFWSLPKPMSIESVMPSTHFILCHLLLLLPPVFPSIRVFFKESALCIKWSKYYSFSLNISPSNEHSGLVSFKIDWFDLLAVQWTLKSLLQ